ncbi:Pentatricopeptide repeat-containing protein [Forsythia ovata]|uniref:Pentatricopeptide repeat-containing protein n=1 Tax=Forsythia ovata TaxID=205694 RepID=A0ABD1VJI7_9LAMI
MEDWGPYPHSEQRLGEFTVIFSQMALVSAGLTRTAVHTFHDMVATEVFNKEKYRVEADFKVYTILIYGWCKIGIFEMARRFWGEMLERGFKPNVVTYNVLFNGICRRASLHPEGRFEKVIRESEEIFDEMSERGVEPDVTSFQFCFIFIAGCISPSCR